MMRHYDELATFERAGFEIIVDKTYEDIDPWSQLSECFDSKEQLYADIDNYKYDWFMLRVRAMFQGHEMGCTYLGGCLYERAETVLTDGTVEDQLIEVLREARVEALRLKQELVELDLEQYAEVE
jgi:hypothetical protein